MNIINERTNKQNWDPTDKKVSDTVVMYNTLCNLKEQVKLIVIISVATDPARFEITFCQYSNNSKTVMVFYKIN